MSLLAFIVMAFLPFAISSWKRRSYAPTPWPTIETKILYIVLRLDSGKLAILKIDPNFGQDIAILDGEVEVYWEFEKEPGKIRVRDIREDSPEVVYNLGGPYRHGRFYLCTTQRSESYAEGITREIDRLRPEDDESFVPGPGIDPITIVADSSIWNFIFVQVGTVDHVIVTPGMWNYYQLKTGARADLEMIKSLPTARLVFDRLKIPFEEENDRPVHANVRDLPPRAELQEFAQRHQKNLRVFLLRSALGQGLVLDQYCFIRPAPSKLSPR